jgi:hypothetical protein
VSLRGTSWYRSGGAEEEGPNKLFLDPATGQKADD